MATKIERKLVKARIPADIYDGLKVLSTKKKISFQRIITDVLRGYVLDNLSTILMKEEK